MRRPVAAIAAVALAAALLLGACGVPTRDSADRASPDDVPFGLLDPERQSDDTSVSPVGTTVDLYVVDGTTGRLIRRSVTLESGELEVVLRQLQEVPDPTTGAGAGNPLADADVILAVDVRRGIATVDLSEGFADLSGADQLTALAEIVYTATARPGVGQVAFTLEGEPVDVPTGDGALTGDPVTRSDYPAFAPLD